jgi:uncharacterized protein YlzI (FlbEa/FlbD family)
LKIKISVEAVIEKENIRYLIQTDHFLRFQCKFCFYRAFELQLLDTHMKEFHSCKPKVYLLAMPLKKFVEEEEFSNVWQNIFHTCRAISCVGM